VVDSIYSGSGEVHAFKIHKKTHKNFLSLSLSLSLTHTHTYLLHFAPFYEPATMKVLIAYSQFAMQFVSPSENCTKKKCGELNLTTSPPISTTLDSHVHFPSSIL
jgi:hypothetical protein